MTLLSPSVTVSLRKINEDDLNERDDYGMPFSEQQYTHGSCYISLFKCKSFDQFDPPNGLKFYTFTELSYYRLKQLFNGKGFVHCQKRNISRLFYPVKLYLCSVLVCTVAGISG